jgi:hypothetical protein
MRYGRRIKRVQLLRKRCAYDKVRADHCRIERRADQARLFHFDVAARPT